MKWVLADIFEILQSGHAVSKTMGNRYNKAHS